MASSEILNFAKFFNLFYLCSPSNREVKLLSFPDAMYVFKVTNRNPRKMFEVCSKLTIKAPERHH